MTYNFSQKASSYRYWDSGAEAADALAKLGWKPTTNPKRVHLWVARRDVKALSHNWSITKEVLLDDVMPDDPGALRNALLALIGIGRPEIIPVLITKLNEVGDKTMAEEYLNCGETDLANAADSWAQRHGYRIVRSVAGANSVNWGSMGQ